jgi:hypothetical protein
VRQQLKEMIGELLWDTVRQEYPATIAYRQVGLRRNFVVVAGDGEDDDKEIGDLVIQALKSKLGL